MVPFGSELVECTWEREGGAHIVRSYRLVCGCEGMRIYILVLAVVIDAPRVRHAGFCHTAGVSRVR